AGNLDHPTDERAAGQRQKAFGGLTENDRPEQGRQGRRDAEQTRRPGDKETRRPGDKETGRIFPLCFGLLVSLSPCLPVSLSPCLLVSLSPKEGEDESDARADAQGEVAGEGVAAEERAGGLGRRVDGVYPA